MKVCHEVVSARRPDVICHVPRAPCDVPRATCLVPRAAARVPAAVQVRDDELVPADLLLLRCGLGRQGQVAFVRTTNLDGETNLKVRREWWPGAGAGAGRIRV